MEIQYIQDGIRISAVVNGQLEWKLFIGHSLANAIDTFRRLYGISQHRAYIIID